MRHQSDQAAFVERTRLAAPDPRPIDFEDQVDDRLHRHEHQQHRHRPRHQEIQRGQVQRGAGHGAGSQQAGIGPHQRETRSRPQQPALVQPRQRRGEAANQEKDQEKEAEQRQGHQRRLGHHDRLRPGQVTPPSVGQHAFQQRQQHGENRHRPFLKLDPGALRREALHILRLEQPAAALGAVQFVELELLQSFAILQPHLEPADRRHQGPDAREERRHLPGQGLAHPRHHKGRHPDTQEDEQIDHAAFLQVSVH